MSGETILIVEDSHDLRAGLREILSYEGFTVLSAGNGREALQQMNAVTPDLILSDISMPVMDGYTFFNVVRDTPDWVAIPIIFLTAHKEPADIIAGKNLGAEDYLTKPVNREELVTAIRSRLLRSQQIQVFQLQQAYEASIITLANAIESRDPYTGGHVYRVRDYAMSLARILGWQEARQQSLRFGAILHDIGKIHVPDSILQKPERLNSEEWEVIRRHPTLSAEMMKSIPYLASAVPIVLHHHERWDGRGYPDQLVGEEIPAGARIVAVVDSYDAMTTTRPYNRMRSLTEAFQEVIDCSGSQFDPQVVVAFQKAWNLGQIQAIAESWQLRV